MYLRHELGDIDGGTSATKPRLIEEGIGNGENLMRPTWSTSHHVRPPAGRLVDWVDQALLVLRLPPWN